MTSNTAVGKYNYNNQDYKLESINYNANGSQLNSDRGFAQIQYNSFKNPTEIFLDGKDRISYDYSILKTRSASYYGSLSTTPTERPNRKFYSADKTIEIVKEGTTTKIITYITGDPYNANYIKIDQLTGSNVDSVNRYYLHRDNQGTILAITTADQSSTIVEQRYFDAWGNLKNAIVGGVVQTPNTMGWINSLLLDRGYTGHEHLKTVGLIHMNGRIYDPQLKRFMSPDNYVQNPYDTQNYNRYGYVLNNPLLYTDPSGEEITLLGAFLIGAAVAVLSNSIANMINGIPFWYGIGKAGVMGGVSGAISFGIGAMATSNFGVMTTVGKALFQAGMHGVSSGLMSEVSGGTFASGFAAGALSSLVSSGIGAIGDSGGYYLDEDYTQWSNISTRNPDLIKAATLAGGALSGGFSSTIAGGKFIDGFRQGLIVSGLNHLVSHTLSGKHKFDREVDKAFGSKADKPVFDMSQEDIDNAIEKIPTLKRIYSKLLLKYKNLKVHYVDKFGSDDGKTFYDTDKKIVTGISIFRSSGSSHRYMSQTILHEFGHAMSGYHGFFFSNFAKYGQYSSIPVAIDEIYAHKFAFHHGGVSYNTPYYDSFVNFLKGTSYKIIADNLKLPSF